MQDFKFANKSEIQEIQNLSKKICLEVGQTVFKDISKSEIYKKGGLDIVTNFDLASEKIIIEMIKKTRPNDGILSEETSAIKVGKTGYTWVIDPLDGTLSFSRGNPNFSISIGIKHDDAYVAGTVYAPASNEIFLGNILEGPLYNKSQPNPAPIKDLEQAIVVTGGSYDKKIRERQADLLRHLHLKTLVVHNYGSAALSISRVALGQADIFYQPGLNEWDFAAGVSIANSAGLLCTDLSGDDPNESMVVVANPYLHKQFINEIKEYF